MRRRYHRTKEWLHAIDKDWVNRRHQWLRSQFVMMVEDNITLCDGVQWRGSECRVTSYLVAGKAGDEAGILPRSMSRKRVAWR